jgi:RHS repeat-associated protein
VEETELVKYGFQGREMDTETGFLNFRNRIYNPVQGRFLQRDPIGFAGGMGLYEFTGGSPHNRGDALGLQDDIWCFIGELGEQRDAMSDVMNYQQRRRELERLHKFFSLIRSMLHNYQLFIESGRVHNFAGGGFDPNQQNRLENFAAPNFTVPLYADADWQQSVPNNIRFLVLRSMRYLLNNYSPGDINIRSGGDRSLNLGPFGIWLHGPTFWTDTPNNIELAIDNLIHEPQHDFSQLFISIRSDHRYSSPFDEGSSIPLNWKADLSQALIDMLDVFKNSNPSRVYQSTSGPNTGLTITTLWQQMLDEAGFRAQ